MRTLSSIDDGEIARRFTSHQPESWQIQAMDAIRADCQDLARKVATLVPPGREQMLAITKLEEFMFIANAGIARPVPGETGGAT